MSFNPTNEMEVAFMVIRESLSRIGIPSTRSMVMLGDGLALRVREIMTSRVGLSTLYVVCPSEIGSFPE